MMATALAVAFVVYSCKGKLGEAAALKLNETPVQTVRDMFVVQSENGKIQMRASADLMEKCGTPRPEYVDYAMGMVNFVVSKQLETGAT